MTKSVLLSAAVLIYALMTGGSSAEAQGRHRVPTGVESLIAVPLSADERVPAVSQTQHEMNQQSEDDYKKADAELNRVYRELMSHLSGAQKEALINAELAWIRFRDANCACWALVHKGGSLYPLLYFSHMESMTRDRIRQLREMKKDMLIDEGVKAPSEEHGIPAKRT